MDLTSLLYESFGFKQFRPNQEAVCRAATDGRDVLLVMPTGAGKSLCYQLPALSRPGTALVISPLIALMEDQAGKLAAAGHPVARIHSGLSREEARQACRDYLDGRLKFLFVAPERMRVPGFPEMLAKRKPALIAIDEAHCISAWGHDFRPDYRTLRDYLAVLRPSPVIALTATATPTVQRDIVAQLGLANPALFIHGFRRHNLGIEVVEMSKPRRPDFIKAFLKPAEARPAIVYAPSRKAAEELASQLGGGAAAYHAGLDAGTRERVQRHFLAGHLDVVVATIAFGMGIDKADVRTVIHMALPGSVEAYYQEIGRAGRDGLPSRTVLLYSFADRKMHDFFLERDYPAATELTRVAILLKDEFQELPELARRLKMDAETIARSVEKLASQGAASIDIAGRVRATGMPGWQTGYEAQLSFRRAQIDRMSAFAEGQECRMTALVRHFGDTEDALRPCGCCDFCAPESATAQTFRAATGEEQRSLRMILKALEGNGRSTGKLFTDLSLTRDRKTFDGWLDGLARAGLITMAGDSFLNGEGRQISYKKAMLTHEGRFLESGDLPVTLRSDDAAEAPDARASRTKRRTSPASAGESNQPLSAQAQKHEDALRAWRKAEAAKTGKPAFLIFSDKTLRAIAEAQPVTLTQLQQVSGVGPEKLDRFGASVLAVLRGEAQDDLTSSESPHPPSVPRSSQSAEPQPQSARSAISTPPASTQNQPLSQEQQALDLRLREWRREESERMGMPQFFVLGSTTLRSLVLERPRTLPDLRRIEGLSQEKTDRFGEALLRLCNAPAPSAFASSSLLNPSVE